MKTQNTNKKSILLPEGLKIIIAVLCILILIYLAWSLYTLFTTKSKLTQAKETLKEIVDKINGLEEGKIEPFLITTPKGWVIMASDDCGNKEGNCIVSCSEDYEGKLQECFEKGIYEPIKFKINIGYYCVLKEQIGMDPRTEVKSPGCFEIGIESVNLLRSGDYVFIGDEGYFSIANALELALKSKDPETGETIDKLIESYIKSRDENIKKKIEETISSYFVSNNLEVRDKWELKLISFSDLQEGEINFGYKLKRGQSGMEGYGYSEYWEHSIKKTRKYNEKEYNSVFNYIKY